MKTIKFLVLLLASVLILTGCPSPTESSPVGDLTIDVTALALTNSTESVVVDNDLQLTVTMTPANASTTLNWASSVESVATVSSAGIITALAEGTTVISVSSSKDPSIKATVTVTVASGILPLTGFKLYNQKNSDGVIDEGTTTEIPGIINNKITLTNTSLSYINSSQFYGNTILYYETALTGDFRIQARILRVNDAVHSVSSNRGVLLGAIAKTAEGDFESAAKYALMMGRTKDEVRSYYYKDNGRGAGSPTITGSLTEYIFELKRDSAGITFSVFNSNTGELIEENTVANTSDTAGQGLDAALISGQPLYPCFIVGGATATISNVKLLSGTVDVDETSLFSTIEVEGTPVAVTGVTLIGTLLNSDDTYDYQTAYTADMDTIQLTAEVVPGSADVLTVTWSSSNTAAATVDANGLVTIVGAGDVTITVTTTDSGFTDKYEMHLTTDAVLTETVTISGSTSIMVGLTTTLSAAISPADATDQTVTWSSDNDSVAAVDSISGVVSGVSAGTGVTITATANDGSTITGTYTVEVTAAESLIFSWNSSNIFDATAAPVEVSGYTVTYRGSSPVVSETGIALGNNRFNIGTHYNDSGSAGAIEFDTSDSVNVDDGEFNFATQNALVTITYTASTGTGFLLYVNNNTSSSSKSVLGGDSKIEVDTALESTGGTTTFTIDRNALGNHESLATAFLQLRADSSTTVNITAISVEYISDTNLFSWDTSNIFDATSAPVTVDDVTVAYRGSSPVVSETGIAMGNNRFNIGTNYADSSSAGATLLETAADIVPDDGEFDFSTNNATVTIVYSASTGTGFNLYINNNTSSSSKSVLGGDSKIAVDTDLIADGGTTTFTIDHAALGDHTSLATAFIQLRADSSTTINITSISIDYDVE